MATIWGIDLGGTKIEGVVLEQAGGEFQVLRRRRIPTEKEKGYEHIIGRVDVLLRMLAEETGIKPQRVGMGTPGTLDPKAQTMKNANTTVLNGRTFKKDLEAATGVYFELANDANCFAVAEARMGVVKDVMPDAQMVFGSIMGTGVGGGIVINGRAWNGGQGIAGEWGHTFLDDSGGPCYCGQTGCTETLISGPALERYYEHLTRTHLHLSEIAARHQAGTDEAATRTMKRLVNFFGKGMANVINTLDPDVVVLGGGLGNLDILYTEGIAAVQHYIFNTRLDTLFLKPKLGDSAGVFGAAMLVS